jgi:hypothetical protein
MCVDEDTLELLNTNQAGVGALLGNIFLVKVSFDLPS